MSRLQFSSRMGFQALPVVHVWLSSDTLVVPAVYVAGATLIEFLSIDSASFLSTKLVTNCLSIVKLGGFSHTTEHLFKWFTTFLMQYTSNSNPFHIYNSAVPIGHWEHKPCWGWGQGQARVPASTTVIMVLWTPRGSLPHWGDCFFLQRPLSGSGWPTALSASLPNAVKSPVSHAQNMCSFSMKRPAEGAAGLPDPNKGQCNLPMR